MQLPFLLSLPSYLLIYNTISMSLSWRGDEGVDSTVES